MAKVRTADPKSQPLHKTLNPPGVFLWRMLIFLALVGFLAAILAQPLWQAVMTNPGLNFLIIAVLFIGILYAFRQVLRLYPEIRWVNAFRIADPGLAISHKPILLAPMATMLRDRTGLISLSTASMRSIMDSIAIRLDEARDTGRYMTGLLVFLGLLGTFWGLLDTIQAVGKTIGALNTSSTTNSMIFEELKSGLASPLKGMGTAFSSSLLGLSGSLVLGFLDLQSSHAHNRFYNELEEWLSGITELTPAGSSSSNDQINRQLFATLVEMQRTLSDINARGSNGGVPGEGGASASGEEAVRDLAKGVDQLVRQMRAEQKVVREWVDEQAAQQSEVASVLKDLAANLGPRRST